MPRYEFRCRACTTTFEVTRPMSAAGDPATCPAGHPDTVKLLTTLGMTGRTRTGAAPASAPAGGGGCCGGGCCG